MDRLSNGLLSEIDVALSPAGRSDGDGLDAGYPGSYEKGVPMALPDAKDLDPDELLFHAGSRQEGDQVVTAGGRVFGLHRNGCRARKSGPEAYGLVDKVKYEGKTFRTDIGSVG